MNIMMVDRILGEDKMKKVANTIKIKRWGNGNGILLPKAILDILSLKVNDSMAISLKDDQIVLTPVKKEYISLSERFKDFEEETQQSEYWDDEPVGKEII
ncbi:MAG: AbrB/MazE/SpoVT family DNA-binding domain-containing protein [Longibaculum sp.]